jgi:hypothetical protein
MMRPTQRKPQTREQGLKLLSLLRSDVTDTEDCCSRLLDLIENQTIWLKLFCQETLFASTFTIEQGRLWARETHSHPPSVALSRFHMLLVAEAVGVWEEFCKLHEKP